MALSGLEEELRQLRNAVMLGAAYQKVCNEGRVDVVTKPLADAVMAARNTPGCQVNLYFTRPEDMIACSDTLMQTADIWLDREKTYANARAGKAVVEFKNGSCIEFKKESR